MLKIILLITMLTSLATPVMAQNDNNPEADDLDMLDEDTERTKKGWLQLYASFGVTYLDADGSFVAALPNGKEVTVIDFERAGLDETDYSYWLTLNWRSPNSRWGAWFGSWQYDAIGSREWGGGLEIPVGAAISTSFDAKWYIVEATYSFIRTETVDAGIGFGFHMVDLDTTINTRIQNGDQEVSNISRRLDTLAPLPNFLAYLHWKFAAKWHLVSRFGYFGLDYDQYSGSMANAHVMFNYELSKRWALGIGYQFVDLDLNVEKSNYVEVYDMDFSGPMVYARFHF